MSDAPILGPMNRADLANADDFQKKHTPYIATERTGDTVKVSVKVGHYVSHPNQPDHFIQWITLCVGDAPLVVFNLSPVAVDPEVSAVLRLDAGTTLTAVEYCNLHGLWAADIVV